MKSKRLAIVTTHPIQYNAPLFKLLQQRGNIAIRVFYTWGSSVLENKYDPGFGKSIKWDIPLLEGYDHVFEKNIAAHPGSYHYKGIDNPELIGHIEEWNADAVLVYGWSFKSHFRCLRYFHKKIPVYFRGDSTLLDEKKGFSLRKTFRRIFLKWVYSHVDKAFYVGIENNKYLLAHGMLNDQLIFAPHAIDNERFGVPDSIYQQKAILWKQSLQIPKNAYVFLFAGKLENKKNPILLLEAFMEIENPDQRLIILGNGPLENHLKKISENDSRVIFINFQNQLQMPVVYRLADVFVLPSQGPGETWGLAVNEAMACGRPVIISDRCGVKSDLVNHETGWVFESGNQSELKKALEICIHDPRQRNNKGIAAREHIKKYSYLEVVKSIEQLIHSII